jgi:hypothetical protein
MTVVPFPHFSMGSIARILTFLLTSGFPVRVPLMLLLIGVNVNSGSAVTYEQWLRLVFGSLKLTFFPAGCKLSGHKFRFFTQRNTDHASPETPWFAELLF